MNSRGYETLRTERAFMEDEDEGEELKRIPSQGALRYDIRAIW